MQRLKTRTAGLLAVLALIGAAHAASVEAEPESTSFHAIAAKSCSAGFTHARLSWGEKCLRAGQFCKRGASPNREYHRYGYHCKRDGHLRRR
jgi:hypothetical protein